MMMEMVMSGWNEQEQGLMREYGGWNVGCRVCGVCDVMWKMRGEGSKLM